MDNLLSNTRPNLHKSFGWLFGLLSFFLSFYFLHQNLKLFDNPWVLIDTDAYMRLFHIEYIREFGENINNYNYRSNFPYGDSLHWTKPITYLWLYGGNLLYFLGKIFCTSLSVGQATLYFSILTQILFFIGFVCVFSKIANFYNISRYISVVVASWQWGILHYSLILRPDHHLALILLAAIMFLGFLKNHNLLIASAGALGLWISFEFLLIIGVLYVFFYLNALNLGQNLNLDIFIKSSYLLSIFSIIIVFIEQNLTLTADKISFFHLLVLLSLNYFMLSLSYSGKMRYFWMLLGGLILLTLYVLKLHHFINPHINNIWHRHIGEMQPIGSLESTFLLLTHGFVALIFSLQKFNKAHIFALSIFFIFSILCMRQILWLNFFSIIPLSYMFSYYFNRLHQRLNTCLILILFMFAPLVLAMLSSNKAQNTDNYSFYHIIPFVKNLPKGTVLSGVDMEGPMLLYYTHHNVIATPYHRHYQAILYTYRVFTQQNDFEFFNLLMQRKINYLVLDRASISNWLQLNKQFLPQNLMVQLMEKKVPPALKDFLINIPVGSNIKNNSNFVIYKVIDYADSRVDEFLKKHMQKFWFKQGNTMVSMELATSPQPKTTQDKQALPSKPNTQKQNFNQMLAEVAGEQ